MNNVNSLVRPVGTIEGIIEHLDGKREVIAFKNSVLQSGRAALASCLANQVGDQFDFFVARMLFGNGGTVGGTPRIVGSDRQGLFGLTVANKPVLASINYQTASSQVIFTAVVGFDDANGAILNEMALQLSNGQYYSMATFADIGKTSGIQITWNWSVSFV